MKYLFTFSFLFFCSWNVIAQELSHEIFHHGYLITSNDDTLAGQIKYNFETNIIILENNQKTLSFSSNQIFYFEIADSIHQYLRKFYSLPYKVNNNYKIPIFFELIYEDKVSLLLREIIIQEFESSRGTNTFVFSKPQLVIHYLFYFLDYEGKIVAFNGRKKMLYKIFRNKMEELKKFMKKEKADPSNLEDLVIILAYYNHLQK